MSNVIKLAKHSIKDGLTARQLVHFANQKRLRLLSNKEFDKRLVGADTWRREQEVYPARTGTLVVYEQKDKKLSTTITMDCLKEYLMGLERKQKYIFDVPKEAQNQKNICLAINHGFDEKGNPIFELKKEGNIVFV